MGSRRYTLGIDLGGTKIKIALVDDLGQIADMKQIPTQPADGPDIIEGRVIDVIQSLCTHITPLAIGIGVPGQIDPKTGTILFAPNLQWHNVPFQSNLSQKLNLPAISTDDVRAAAIGEWYFGAGKGCEDFFCLFIGTGIGGGIVAGGRLLDGASHTAGEIGHMIIDINGPQCTCGNFGCLEAIGGGWAIAKQAQEAVSAQHSQSAHLQKKCQGNIEAIDAKMVIEAWREGDILSQKIISKAIAAIVAGSINIINVLNPARLILGGGVFEGIPELLAHIKQGIEQRALAAARSNLQVLPAHLLKDAGVIGASCLAFKQFGK